MSAFTYFILGELRYLTLPSNIGIQKAMESSAFPNIIMVKLMKLKMYTLMNISMSPKIMQMHIKLYIFSLETSGKYPFPF